MPRKSRALPPSPFRRFNSSPEVIRLVVLMYVRFPLSLRNVEDLLFELPNLGCGAAGPLYPARLISVVEDRGVHWRPLQ